MLDTTLREAQAHSFKQVPMFLLEVQLEQMPRQMLVNQQKEVKTFQELKLLLQARHQLRVQKDKDVEISTDPTEDHKQ